jgi:hypothetical protein
MAAGHAKLFCDMRVGTPEGDHFEYSGNAHLVQNWTVVFPSPIRSALFHHIAHVVGVRSQKKVLRIAARRAVAFVQDIKAFGDRSIFSLPRDVVSIPKLGAVLTMPVAAHECTAPRPAGVAAARFVDSEKIIKGLPKALLSAYAYVRYLFCSHCNLPSCVVRGAVPFAAGGTSILYTLIAGAST